ELGDGEAQRHAEQATDARQHHGLDQELLSDIAALGPQGPANADLPRPFGHGREHDVHDPDPADQQRDRRDRAQDDAELAGLPLVPAELARFAVTPTTV